MDEDIIGVVPKIPKLRESKPRKGFIELDECKTLEAHLPDDLSPIVTIAFQTSMRKSEILGLQWKNIDRKANTITIEDTKNTEDRTFYMDDVVRAVINYQFNLKWRGSGRKTLYVFHRNGKRISDFRGA